MNFKEECLKLYDDIAKRSETERKKRVADSVKRERNLIIKSFESHFNRPFKEEYLNEKQEEWGYTKFTIEIDEIRIRVSFRDNNYYGAYYLLVPCHKCGEETTYRNDLCNSFLHNIGRILNEPPASAPYARICGECDGKRRDLEREQREERYTKQSKERGDDLFIKLADALAKVFRRAGYRDLYKDEGDYDYEG